VHGKVGLGVGRGVVGLGVGRRVVGLGVGRGVVGLDVGLWVMSMHLKVSGGMRSTQSSVALLQLFDPSEHSLRGAQTVP
jgi:hypothetical protein